MKKWTYNFGDGEAAGNARMKNILGGKGANLAEMSRIGLPVPLGFTISSELCAEYFQNSKQIPASLTAEIQQQIKHMEQNLGQKFGDHTTPLLVSVRSGSRSSMPGMMDTILNLGLNDHTVEGLAKRTTNPRFAYDSYRRFIQMYADVVLGVDHFLFEEILSKHRDEHSIKEDSEFSADTLKIIIDEFKKLIEKQTDITFPADVHQQLLGAINAVMDSWMNNRAIIYRRIHNIPEEWGTAVNIQSMVFGNMDDNSATGVLFTRNPSTGTKELFGEFLLNAQGEDVVAGIRTPLAITKEHAQKSKSMEQVLPRAFEELKRYATKLEDYYKDVQDIEFTIQQGKLWILQTRSAKRTTQAALKIAVDMVSEGIITKEEALLSLNPNSLEQLLHPSLDRSKPMTLIGKGLPASPGAASGIVVFSADDAEKLAKNCKVILVRSETSPEDINGMHAAEGILTSRGGMTSHAAVVARGMGKSCVCGAVELLINAKEKIMIAGEFTVKEGEKITIDGSTGEIILGEVDTITSEISEDFSTIMRWATTVKKIAVRANAETMPDAKLAKQFGAEGIGLCRTEHMFFDASRINVVREMILANSQDKRVKALAKILPMQINDFLEIFKVMENLPINIRLLDPPLHEFLPTNEADLEKIGTELEMSKSQIHHAIAQLEEQNPMLGHRGCRLGISYPEIYQMQVNAIFEAMVKTSKTHTMPKLEIMIPLVATAKELALNRVMIEVIAKEIEQKHQITLPYSIGTMIELPRAAIMAEQIAHHADYFSFGTNDLTQTTYGISRDDSSSFLEEYLKHGIFKADPFAHFDQEGVGQLVQIAIERGKRTKPQLKTSVCGEHGGDAESVKFFARLGMNYVSCSPYRIPIAILAAAQEAVAKK